MTSHSLAGVAKVDITPPVGVMLEAYHRDGPSTGTLDRLYVTALLLARQRDEPLVILGVDNVALLPSETDSIREVLAQKLGIGDERVMILLSHTHSGPRITPGYLQELHEKAIEAAERAAASLVPATLGWGVGHVDASVNRRPQCQRRPELAPPSRAIPDQRVGILRVNEHNGRPLAALIWYTAHGSVLKRDSNVISADWPGAVRHVVEKGTDCTVLVAPGAAGNVDARWRGSPEALQRMGSAVGGEATTVFDHIETHPLTSLEVRSETIPLRLEPIPEEPEARRLAAEAAEAWGVSTDAWLAEVRRCRERGEIHRTLPMEVHIARINEGIIGGIPMEAFTEIAIAVAERFPGRPVFFGGYTNAWIGYLPTPEEYPSGGYEVEWMPVVYGPESGLLTPPRPETASQVISTATRLISQVMSQRST